MVANGVIFAFFKRRDIMYIYFPRNSNVHIKSQCYGSSTISLRALFQTVCFWKSHNSEIKFLFSWVGSLEHLGTLDGSIT